MKMKLERGDACFVRLISGKVVTAKYDERIAQLRCHWVTMNGRSLIVGREITGSCGRLVYPLSEMKRQMRLQ